MARIGKKRKSDQAAEASEIVQENGSSAPEDTKTEDAKDVNNEKTNSTDTVKSPPAKKAKKAASANGKIKKRTTTAPERKSSRVPPKTDVYQSEVTEPKKRKVDKNKEYEVEKIIKSKLVRGKTEYLVRWKGYSSKNDTWEPAKNLNCDDLIEKFGDEPSSPKKKKTVAKPKKSPKKSVKKSPLKKKKTVAKKTK